MVINNWLIGGGAFIAGALGALVVIVFGRRWSLLDRPNERSSHEKVTPRGGGIGILAALVFCSIVYSLPVYFWVPALLVSLISFGGDRCEIGVSIRLGTQFFLAACFLWFAVTSQTGDANFFTSIAITFFYLIFIVGTANYYNFMDGINGIAAITGIVAFGLLGSYGAVSGKEPGLVNLCFVVIAACAGFLPFNAPKAWVFMGDVGSVLLGFIFAGLVVMMAATITEFVLLAGFLFPFYADELVTLWERVWDGDRLTRAHRRHLYQVLVNEAGLAHWQVSAGYGLLQLFIGMTAWKASTAGLPALLVVLTLFFAAFILVNNRIKDRYLVKT